MANNPTISQIRVPNGTGATDYDIADLEARSGVETILNQAIPQMANRVTDVEEAISGTGGTGGINARLDAIDLALEAGIRIIGATSTELTEGSTTDELTPAAPGSLSKLTEFEKGDVVFYTKGTGENRVIQEFVKTGRTDPLQPEKSGVWVLFGDSSILANSLGDFAYVNTGHTSGFTPSGTISYSGLGVYGVNYVAQKTDHKVQPLYNDTAVVKVVGSGSDNPMYEVGVVNSFNPGQIPTVSVVAGPSSTNILQFTSGTAPDLIYENVTFQYGNRLAPSSTYTGGTGKYAEVVTKDVASGNDEKVSLVTGLSTGSAIFSGTISGLTFSGNTITGLEVAPGSLV